MFEIIKEVRLYCNQWSSLKIRKASKTGKKLNIWNFEIISVINCDPNVILKLLSKIVKNTRVHISKHVYLFRSKTRHVVNILLSRHSISCKTSYMYHIFFSILKSLSTYVSFTKSDRVDIFLYVSLIVNILSHRCLVYTYSLTCKHFSPPNLLWLSSYLPYSDYTELWCRYFILGLF